jgi:hypothetical protein
MHATRSPIVIVAAHHLRRLIRRPALVLFLTAVPLTLAFVESAAFGPATTANGTPPPVPVRTPTRISRTRQRRSKRA